MRDQTNTRTAAEALVDQLVLNGVRHAFCDNLRQAAEHFDSAPVVVTSRVVGYREMKSPLRAGFALARRLLEESRPDVLITFADDHFDRCFYDNLPAFLIGVGE